MVEEVMYIVLYKPFQAEILYTANTSSKLCEFTQFLLVDADYCNTWKAIRGAQNHKFHFQSCFAPSAQNMMITPLKHLKTHVKISPLWRDSWMELELPDRNLILVVFIFVAEINLNILYLRSVVMFIQKSTNQVVR